MWAAASSQPATPGQTADISGQRAVWSGSMSLRRIAAALHSGHSGHSGAQPPGTQDQDLAQHSMAQPGTVQHGTAWYSTSWHNLVQHSTVQLGTTLFGRSMHSIEWKSIAQIIAVRHAEAGHRASWQRHVIDTAQLYNMAKHSTEGKAQHGTWHGKGRNRSMGMHTGIATRKMDK